MCTTCGCGHTHQAHPNSYPEKTRSVRVEEDILARNNADAALLRTFFRQHRILTLNLVSSPGSGKTELLAATVRHPLMAEIPLEAQQILTALPKLNPADRSVLFIENVGNLVCPAEFDLGEAHKVALISVTEGDDKPLKYPDMFAAADLVIINKTDLAPYVRFDLARCETYARRINPRVTVLRLSAVTGVGLDAWCRWLQAQLAAASL